MGWSEVKYDLDEQILSEEGLEILQSFTNDQRKGEFLTTRHLFWKLIDELNWDSKSITLGKEPTGKPFIENNKERLFVSFSHSQNLVMCAISDDLDIGLDIENLNRKVNPAILKRILNNGEWELYSKEDPLSLWTIKEATVKSLGTGLRTNLKDLVLDKQRDGLFTITVNQKEELKAVCFKALNHWISLAY